MEKPILFNTEMVRAILDGRKTQTRRLIRPQPEGQLSYIMGGSGTLPGKWDYMSASSAKAWDVEESRICKQDDGRLWTPPCHADDVLYVRETWNGLRTGPKGEEKTIYWYRADEDDNKLNPDDHWRPSIHMPKAAARIWLKVKRVRVERLQDMTAQDSLDEGVKLSLQGITNGEPTLAPFAKLWDSTLKKGEVSRYGWSANPWVWVIEFERLEGKHDEH